MPGSWDTPRLLGVAKGLAPNKSSSIARDMTGLRAHLSHGSHCPPEFRESQYLSSQQNPHLTDYSVYPALCTAIPTSLQAFIYFFFFSHLPGVIGSKSKIIKQAKSHIKKKSKLSSVIWTKRDYKDGHRCWREMTRIPVSLSVSPFGV